MNLLERVLTLLQANLNSVVEKADDPEKVLQQLQLDMRNQLVQVKTQVATAIAEGHRLQKRSQEQLAEADTWLKKAALAAQQGNDTAARSALSRYNNTKKLAERYQQQKQEQDQLVQAMREVLRRLEAKISEAEATIDLLAARKRNALIQQRVFDALNKVDQTGSQEKFSKAQDSIQENEARARALAELQQRDLDTQLEQLSEDQIIEQQLASLKQNAPEPRLLPEHKGRLSPLQPPQPRRNEPSRNRPAREKPSPQPSPTPPQENSDLDLEQLKKLLDLP
ncbi:MAG: PspA/IM30 family protein [Ktedonobacteraceae bacterium]|nr:PspA/IM30 family protein [Ktedonobacteraceae bacterium]